MEKLYRLTSRFSTKPEALTVKIEGNTSERLNLRLNLDRFPTIAAQIEVDTLPFELCDLAVRAPDFVERLNTESRTLLRAFCRERIVVSLDGGDILFKEAGSISRFADCDTPFSYHSKTGACLGIKHSEHRLPFGEGALWYVSAGMEECLEILEGYRVEALIPALARAGFPRWNVLVDREGALIGGFLHWEEVQPGEVTSDTPPGGGAWELEHFLERRGGVFIPAKVGQEPPIDAINALMEQFDLQVERQIDSGLLFREIWVTMGIKT